VILANVAASAGPLLAQGRGGGGGDAAGGMGAMLTACVCPLVMFVLFFGFFAIIGWKIYTKAGRPGWEAIVPIYNTWILVTEICKLEPLWFILSLIPFVNIVASWKICQALANKFGKSDTFGIGLFFLGPIFAAMLAFGDARYQGRRRPRDDYDDDEEEEEEEEEEERPRSKRRPRDEDDEDEDDRPRKRRSRDDD
jgi:hypothetical protein